jgi:hypothetical protein
MGKGPQAGDAAPDFELPGTTGAFRLLEHRVVRYRHDSLLGLTYQTVDDLRAALDSLPAPAAGA